ncbi:MAG: hypothetical protein DRP65_00290 [Planctomycetota bacterium]|nr:MAG: hypothetical protein DRP65_00290 [Planctomycetota bacterium]
MGLGEKSRPICHVSDTQMGYFMGYTHIFSKTKESGLSLDYNVLITKCLDGNYLDNNDLSPYNNNGKVIFYYNDIEVVNEIGQYDG